MTYRRLGLFRADRIVTAGGPPTADAPTAPSSLLAIPYTSGMGTAFFVQVVVGAAFSTTAITQYEFTLNGTPLGRVITPADFFGDAGGLTLGTADGLSQGTSYTLTCVARNALNNVGPAATTSFTTPVVAPEYAVASIGGPALSALATSNDKTAGTVTLGVSGRDIGGASDSFGFAYDTNGSGDIRLTGRVASITGPVDASAAGIMFRASTAANADYFAILQNKATVGVEVSRRLAGVYSVSFLAGPTAPEYLRLSRVGSTLTAQHSADGVTWTTAATLTGTLPGSLLIGAAVVSRQDVTTATGTFDNLAVAAL